MKGAMGSPSERAVGLVGDDLAEQLARCRIFWGDEEAGGAFPAFLDQGSHVPPACGAVAPPVAAPPRMGTILHGGGALPRLDSRRRVLDAPLVMEKDQDANFFQRQPSARGVRAYGGRASNSHSYRCQREMPVVPEMLPWRRDAPPSPLEDFLLCLAAQQAHPAMAGVITSRAADLEQTQYGQHLLNLALGGCGEEDLRTMAIAGLTSDPVRFFRICVARTDEVLRMVRSLGTTQQLGVVSAALLPLLQHGLIMMHTNGLRILKGCLDSFPTGMSQVIFNAIIRYCTRVACDQNGLALLQDGLKCSDKNRRDAIIFAVSSNSLHIAQNCHGNYIVQDVLNRKVPSSLAIIAARLRWHYVELSTQKYSSNVVEACLRVFGDREKSIIINELLLHPHWIDLVSDEYANYVISTALTHCKDPLRRKLASAIRSLDNVNERHPHCLKIFNILSKKGFVN